MKAETISALAGLVLAFATLVQVLRVRTDVNANTTAIRHDVSQNTTATVAAASAATAAANDAKTAATQTAETLGAVNGHGTAMEALAENSKVLAEGVARSDKLLELWGYTHKNIHRLGNIVTPIAPKVDQLWKDAGHADEPDFEPFDTAKDG